ncbi:FmdB family zinc ribbon protein [Nocardioides mesophilus]|uniref:FmdB family transcriptional regulator n=1 Tax=Nocardioides mesophilus TaxID=433659 RepID=A0A7G9R7I6_9ACTN|nr:FmdB family zinc ribbon protein [Nocardioides mesophilus]QNN51561.1 FmdB family transcriptional regulator [Nocardioides mesophilus]
MPTYQYACTECEHTFEQFQSFSEDSLTVCPVCQGRLRKVFNAVGVVFKGSGFYRTDNRAEAKTASTTGTPAGSGGSGDGTSTSTPSTSDSKPGTKSDSKPSTSGSPTSGTSGSAA